MILTCKVPGNKENVCFYHRVCLLKMLGRFNSGMKICTAIERIFFDINLVYYVLLFEHENL